MYNIDKGEMLMRIVKYGIGILFSFAGIIIGLFLNVRLGTYVFDLDCYGIEGPCSCFLPWELSVLHYESVLAVIFFAFGATLFISLIIRVLFERRPNILNYRMTKFIDCNTYSF